MSVEPEFQEPRRICGCNSCLGGGEGGPSAALLMPLALLPGKHPVGSSPLGRPQELASGPTSGSGIPDASLLPWMPSKLNQRPSSGPSSSPFLRSDPEVLPSQLRRVGRFRGFGPKAALLPAWAPSGLGQLRASEATRGIDGHRNGFAQQPAAGLPRGHRPSPRLCCRPSSPLAVLCLRGPNG
ncbi:hypothetical protein E2320_007252 [Naja naja]|nr:hypothetical protein E2320_007252 [Naja naja]